MLAGMLFIECPIQQRIRTGKAKCGLMSFFGSADKKQAISWAFYDFANSSYSLLIISFVFPIYFKEVISVGYAGDFYWGLAVSISILLGGIVAPVMGAAADFDSRRKTKFVFFALMAMLGTASLFFAEEGELVFAMMVFIFSNFFFELALVFYDSFLPSIADEHIRGRISGLGWGLGYVGGLAAMGLLSYFYSSEIHSVLYRLTFPLTALFFLFFALPAFIFIKETTKRSAVSLLHLAKVGFSNTITTLRSIRKYRDIAWFLLAFYFLNDALVTLFAFTPIYARDTLQLSMGDIAIVFAIIQAVGFPSAVFFGFLADKFGSKKVLLATIFIWAAIIIGLSLVQGIYWFYTFGIMTGLVIGSSQAVARSWLSKLIPEEKRSQFFGFNAFAGKISATTGPIVFGVVSTLAGQRWALVSLIPFFIVSFVLFSRIKSGK